MCMPTPPVTKSAMRSRSATQRATWSRVSGLTAKSIVAGRGWPIGRTARVGTRRLPPPLHSSYFRRSTARWSWALFIFERPAMFIRFASLYSCSLVRPRGRFVPDRCPPRRPEDMSRRDVREDSFASPLRARSLLTVRAAISLARFVEAPPLLLAFLDVLVLAFSLVAPCVLRHREPPFVAPFDSLCPFPGVPIAAPGAESTRIRLESGRLRPVASASGGGRNHELPTLGGDVGDAAAQPSSGGFWTLCSVAYAFVSSFTTSKPWSYA